MNNETLFHFLMTQMVWQSPALLVYVGAILICALRARRAPRAATLAIIGLGLMLLGAVGVTVVQGVAIQRLNAGSASWRQVMMITGVVGVVVRAAGVGLLVAAVFAGRLREVGGGFEVAAAASSSP